MPGNSQLGAVQKFCDMYLSWNTNGEDIQKNLRPTVASGGSPLSGLLFKVFDTENFIGLSNVEMFKQSDYAVSPSIFYCSVHNINILSNS